MRNIYKEETRIKLQIAKLEKDGSTNTDSKIVQLRNELDGLWLNITEDEDQAYLDNLFSD